MYSPDSAAVGFETRLLIPRIAGPPDGLPPPGGTPLLRLSRIETSLPAGVELWGKAEFHNPSGSVKDRAADAIVRRAMAEGQLGHDRTLLDASSGNTAVAYARLGALLGFPVALCVPRTANPERLERMRSFGARVILTDPIDGTEGAQREARRLATAEPDRYFYADQYRNPSNPNAHYESTGPEIWNGMQGQLTHLVAGVGTGGTVTGTGRFLKERDRRIRVIGVQPSTPLHGIEGLKHLPTSRVPATYDARVVDRTVRVSTETAVKWAERIALEEGHPVGVSSGAAVAAAVRVGSKLRSARMVVILPDARRPERPTPGGARA